MAIETRIKKIGDSLGLIIPDEIVKEKNLKSGEKVFVEINKPVHLRKFFGILKGKTRMTGQEFKDLARKGWNDNDESDNVKRKLDIQSFLGILP